MSRCWCVVVFLMVMDGFKGGKKLKSANERGEKRERERARIKSVRVCLVWLSMHWSKNFIFKE